MGRNFGLSNIYLKIGIALVVISMAMLVTTFVVPSATRFAGGRMAGFCFVSGALLYVIGRITQVRRAHA